MKNSLPANGDNKEKVKKQMTQNKYLVTLAIVVVFLAIIVWARLQPKEADQPREAFATTKAKKAIELSKSLQSYKNHSLCAPTSSDTKTCAEFLFAQIEKAFAKLDCKKPLSMHLFGSDNLREIASHLAKNLLLDSRNFVIVNGSLPLKNFISEITQKLSIENRNCPSHMIGIDITSGNDLTVENRNFLEGALDDSAPLWHPIPHKEFLTSRVIFVILSDITKEIREEIERKEFKRGSTERHGIIRSIMRDKWTGRFYQRINSICGL